jgi:hypothetical protein
LSSCHSGLLTRRRFALVLSVVFAFFVGACNAYAKPREPSECTRKAGEFSPGATVKPTITLTPDLPTQTINFGGDRGWQFAEVVLTASRPLPTNFKPEQLNIEVLRQFARQSETDRSVTLAPPTFTTPVINPSRNTITFAVCFDGSGLSAGHYNGAVTVEGFSGIGPTSVAFNLNAQNRAFFLTVLIASALLTLFLLFWRGAARLQSDNAKAVVADVNSSLTEGASVVSQKAAADAQKPLEAGQRFALKGEVLRDPMFWVGTVLSTVAAIAAAWAIYSANSSWGVNPVTEAFAIVSAVLAAAGFQSLLTSAAGK